MSVVHFRKETLIQLPVLTTAVLLLYHQGVDGGSASRAKQFVSSLRQPLSDGRKRGHRSKIRCLFESHCSYRA